MSGWRENLPQIQTASGAAEQLRGEKSTMKTKIYILNIKYMYKMMDGKIGKQMERWQEHLEEV